MKTSSLIGAILASAALAACGGSDESSEPAAAAPADTGMQDEAATEMAAAEPAAEPEPAPAQTADAPAEPDMTETTDAAEAAPGTYLIAGLTGNADAGRRVFARCRSCHVLDEGVNRVGPSLYGIFGRPAGSVEGFRYSEANSNSGVVWSGETMFEYLENPREYIPGTIMAFPGIRDAQDRADLIAYIKDNGGLNE